MSVDIIQCAYLNTGVIKKNGLISIEQCRKQFTYQVQLLKQQYNNNKNGCKSKCIVIPKEVINHRKVYEVCRNYF